MKRLLKTILSTLLILNISSAIAISAPSEITLNNATSSSLEISWTEVPNAIWYYVYYSTSSENLEFSDMWDLFENTWVTIEGLEANTTYFVSVKSINEELEESDFAPEASFSTLEEIVEEVSSETWTTLSETWATQYEENLEESIMNEKIVKNMKLESIETIYSDEYELQFNNMLNEIEWTPRNIKIVNKDNEFETFISTESKVVDWNRLNVILDNSLESNTEYEVIVIELYDTDGNNIENWVNASLLFTTPMSFDEKPVIEETIQKTDEDWLWVFSWDENEEDLDLNAASEEDSESEEVKSASVAWAEAEKLPDTWPTHILLLVLALFFWLVWFTFTMKNRS